MHLVAHLLHIGLHILLHGRVEAEAAHLAADRAAKETRGCTGVFGASLRKLGISICRPANSLTSFSSADGKIQQKRHHVEGFLEKKGLGGLT